MANALSELIFGKGTAAEQAPVGKGMAQRTKESIGLRQRYEKYTQDAMISGEQPMSFEQWVQSQQV